MTTSENIAEIAAALAKAQASMKNAALNKVNPHFRNRYADLAAIRDAVVPELAKNGIAVVQGLGVTDGGIVGLTTRLMHTSGQWVESDILLPACADMQKMGSAITYARRYSLSAICGIAADEDDDANAASTPAQSKPDAVPDEKYNEWVVDIEAMADSGAGYDAVVAAIKKSNGAFQARLREDGKRWLALKKKAEEREAKQAVPA
jgi:hypothetical protein